MEAGAFKPILQKLDLFQTKYWNSDGVWWQSIIERTTIPRTCSTKLCNCYSNFYYQELFHLVHDALPLQGWHLHPVLHYCLWTCNEWHSKGSCSGTSKHIHNWYNVVLCKFQHVHKGDGFLWYFAISVLMVEHYCAFEKTWYFPYKRGPIIAKLALLQAFIEEQLASHVDTLTPPNGRPEIALRNWSRQNSGMHSRSVRVALAFRDYLPIIGSLPT